MHQPSHTANPTTTGLRRTLDEVNDLHAGEYLECPHCRSEWDRADLGTLDLSDREHVLCTCGKSGFVLRGSRRTQSVAARRPMLSGTFYPSATELRDYGKRLGLDGIDRVVIEAIDDFPPGWDMTKEAIAEKAGVKIGRVRTTLRKLRGWRDGDKDEPSGPVLIESTEVRWNGRVTGVQYDLTPLWNALAALAAETADDAGTSDKGVTASEIDPQSASEIDPHPLDVQSSKNLFLTKERGQSHSLSDRVPPREDSEDFNSSTEGGTASLLHSPNSKNMAGVDKGAAWNKNPAEMKARRAEYEAEQEAAA